MFNVIQDVDSAHDQFIQDILQITIPTQVIWGKQDNVRSSGGVYKKGDAEISKQIMTGGGLKGLLVEIENGYHSFLYRFI